MKKLLLPLLFASASLFAQKETYVSVSLGADIKNAVLGSKPTNNNPSADLILSLNMVGNNFEISVGNENFNQIGFNRFFIDFGYHDQRYIPFPNKDLDITIIPSIGFSNITRYGKEDRILPSGEFIYGKSAHIAVQGNLSFRVPLSDKFLIDLTVNAMTRPDLAYLYPTDPNKKIVFSNFIKLHYIIN